MGLWFYYKVTNGCLRIVDHTNIVYVENLSNRITLNSLKYYLKEKLFDWGKKDIIYKQVINDLYSKDILDDNDIKSI